MTCFICDRRRAMWGIVLGVAVVAACAGGNPGGGGAGGVGGGGGGGVGGGSISIRIDPYSANLAPGATQQFRVIGTDRGVRWSATGGTITDAGVYTAGNGTGQYEIRATVIDNSLSLLAMVWVAGPVYIAPSLGSLPIGMSQQFTAMIRGESVATTDLNWSIQEGDAGGSATTTGLYTAPNQQDTYRVIARNKANDAEFAVASMSIFSGPFVVILPSEPTVPPGGTEQFTLTVSGLSTLPAFAWSVSGFGTITEGGLYTAPPSGETTTQIIARSTSATIPWTVETKVHVSTNPCYGRACGSTLPDGSVCCSGGGCEPAYCDSECGHPNACGACVPTGIQECFYGMGVCSDGVCYGC